MVNLKYGLPTKQVINLIYRHIWSSIDNKIKTDYNPSKHKNYFENLIIYDILDGTRTTLPKKNVNVAHSFEIPMYLISLIHILSMLGSRSLVVLIHTSYNRNRGDKEFKRIENNIKKTYDHLGNFFKKYSIHCHCLYPEEYEFAKSLENLEYETKEGTFDAYFLFDYNENWQSTHKGRKLVKILPEIDVHIRHTKFQPSGGWIPGKMKKSAFLYSQNGTIFSNWKTDEMVSLVSMALLTKILNDGEALTKSYISYDEIKYRYSKREIGLFEKTIYLRKNPTKLYMMGSPIGPYIIYY